MVGRIDKQEFTVRCHNKHLNLNVSKTKELVVARAPVTILVEQVGDVGFYRYLGVQIHNKLDWSTLMPSERKHRELQSFNMCNKLLRMFH